MIVLMSVKPARMRKQERRHQCDERQRDRDEHRHEGAEDDEQHDQRRKQAEQLLCALLDRRELGVAVVLDRTRDRLHRLANPPGHQRRRFAVLLVDDPVELSLRVGDAAVVGEGVLVERVADALDPRLVLARRELVGLELRDRVLDRLAALGGIEPLAGGAAKTRFGTPAPPRTPSLDQVGRLCVSEPGSRTVLEAAADTWRRGRSGRR